MSLAEYIIMFVFVTIMGFGLPGAIAANPTRLIRSSARMRS